MVINELRQKAINRLIHAGISDTAALDVMVLMKHVWNTDEIGLVMHGNQQADDDMSRELFSLLERRCKGEPIAYLCGSKEFMSHSFFVEPGVLIPRGDTECVVECALSLLSTDTPRILDIGTGSGCIAISIAKALPKALVFALDVSDVALQCAKSNAEKNNVNILFQKMDILTEEPNGKFDLIISNPPYICSEVVEKLEGTVKDYEPHSALDGGEDGLLFYKRLIPLASNHLNLGGSLVLEIGYDQGKKVSQLIQSDKSFASPRMIYDLAGRDRGVYTTKEKDVK